MNFTWAMEESVSWVSVVIRITLHKDRRRVGRVTGWGRVRLDGGQAISRDAEYVLTGISVTVSNVCLAVTILPDQRHCQGYACALLSADLIC